VRQSFTTQFPEGRLKKWEARPEGYIVRFRQEGKLYFAYYSADGVWQGTEKPVRWTRHLPGTVQDAWKRSDYKGWYVHAIKKINTPERQLFVLHVTNGPLLTSDNHDAFREDHVLYYTPEGKMVERSRI
jgi:hypothetical protein